LKSFYKKSFPATTVSTLHSFWWFSLFFSFLSNTLFATDYKIKLTATNNQDYIFNSSGLNLVNVTDPNFTVKVGDKLTFDVSEVAGNNHPFAIVTGLTNGAYDPDKKVSGVLFNGEPAVSEVSWNLTGVTPGLYYYICTNHSS
jgi:plastocyanin